MIQDIFRFVLPPGGKLSAKPTDEGGDKRFYPSIPILSLRFNNVEALSWLR